MLRKKTILIFHLLAISFFITTKIAGVATNEKNLPKLETENKAKKSYLTSIMQEKPEQQSLLEVAAIFTYIQKYHHNISSADAKEIANELVVQCSENNMDPKFIAALISAESGFNKAAKSRSGAKGLGQLMNQTFARFKLDNPFDIKQNIFATTQYMKNIIDQWDGHSLQLTYALATYLRGEFAIKRANGQLSPFTTKYINNVFKRYNTLCELKDNTALSQ